MMILLGAIKPAWLPLLYIICALLLTRHSDATLRRISYAWTVEVGNDGTKIK